MSKIKQKIIALVGRPNVGKSTLFNRLSMNKKAIVHDIPGVTRDRKYATGVLGSLEFTIIDTPGLEESDQTTIQHRMSQQTCLAIEESDIVCFIIDGKHGITAVDEFFANLIRKYNKQPLLVINKCEKGIHHDSKYYKLGFGDPIAISAEHNIGMMELHDRISAYYDHSAQITEAPLDYNTITVAIIGRPNVGKSTFVNAIIQDNRVLTGPEAGITRESIEIEWFYKGYNIKIIDTAGLRKKSVINDSLEQLSASDAINSINFAHVVVMILDANQALEQQDLNIANYAIKQGRCLVVAVNKWDLIKDKEVFKDEFFYTLSKNLSKVQGVPVVFISAKNKHNISSVFDECINIYGIWNQRISTNKLNNWLNLTTTKHPLPLKKTGRRVRIKYMTQTKTRPPTFKLFSNNPELITESYQKYLTNALRQEFNMPGVPIRLIFPKVKNPYE